jgi:SAM-dependent methyltransferase
LKHSAGRSCIRFPLSLTTCSALHLWQVRDQPRLRVRVNTGTSLLAAAGAALAPMLPQRAHAQTPERSFLNKFHLTQRFRRTQRLGLGEAKVRCELRRAQPREIVVKNQFSEINASKASFDNIYTQPDPRAYYSVLGELDYMIPDLARPVIRQLLSARAARAVLHSGQQRPASKLKVLDVGCSYGINAAMHKYPVTVSTLNRRYTRREMKLIAPEELIHLDGHYYASWPDIGVANFIGLDASQPAVDYGQAVGLLESGVVRNLEQDELSAEEQARIADTDVILSTGCIGYVTEVTYQKLIQALPNKPWVISFVLRMFPYEPFIRVLADHGLVTEKLTSTSFAQRRFRDADEFQSTLQVLRERGVDPSGIESQGLLHAELWVSRPAEEVQKRPLAKLLTISNSLSHGTGARYVMVEQGGSNYVVMEP